MATIAILGTLDSKGDEHQFIVNQLHQQGHQTLLINVGTLENPTVPADLSLNDVLNDFEEDWTSILARKDRGECVSMISRAVAKFVPSLFEQREIHGIISLGGGGGTAIGTAAMRSLPIGIPKLMVTTLASGNTSAYVGTSDLILMPAIVDVSGINRISQRVFTHAAAAIGAMAAAYQSSQQQAYHGKKLIAASMFGNTTACIDTARKHLEANGCEVLIFHATGTGGRLMESLIRSGMIDGVLDLTPTEWADQLVGGILGAGEDRMNAAADLDLPTVIAPGCLDMVNFGEPNSVPQQFANRLFYHHNPQVTLMRTTAEENTKLGQILAEKANRHFDKVCVLLPQQGISVISKAPGPFYDSAADQALFSAIQEHLQSHVQCQTFDCDINDERFALACANALLQMLKN